MIHKTKNRPHKILLSAIAVIILITLFAAPNFYMGIIEKTDFSLITNVLLFLPGFFILIGLFDVWLPEKFIVSHLGKHSGFKGAFYSFVLGIIIPGPLYVSFPIAASLVRKGVSRFNVALFICSWSSFKVAEEVFELQFLGAKFLLLRLLISLPAIIIISFVIDRVYSLEKPSEIQK